MRKAVSISLVAALSCGPALAQTPTGQSAPVAAEQPAPPSQAKKEEKPGVVENVSGAVGGVLASSAAAAGGPLASAAASVVGNKVGRGIGGFFKRLFGGGKKKAAAAPQQQVQAAPSADQAAQQASAQVQQTPATQQTPPQAAADPIGDVLEQSETTVPAQ